MELVHTWDHFPHEYLNLFTWLVADTALDVLWVDGSLSRDIVNDVATLFDLFVNLLREITSAQWTFSLDF